MRCIFAPCDAEYELLTSAPSSLRPTETVQIVPEHRMEGEGSWFGMCPASYSRVPPLPEQREFMRQAEESYATQMEARARGWRFGLPPRGSSEDTTSTDPALLGDPEPCVPCGEKGLTVLFDHRLDLVVHLERDHQIDVRADVNRPPAGEVETFFPVRPAETEEFDNKQTRTTDPATAPGVGGGMAGRGELRGSLSLAIEAAGEVNSICSEITLKLEEITAAMARLSEHQQIAAAMTINAIDDPDDAPEPARQMVVAASRLGELTREQHAAVHLLSERNDGTYRISRQMIDKGHEYQAHI